MPTRRMLLLGGAFTAIAVVATPFKVVVDADGLFHVASLTAAARDGAGNGGSGGNGGRSGGSGGSGGNSSSGSAGSGGSGSSGGSSTGSGNTGASAGAGSTGSTGTDGVGADGTDADSTDTGSEAGAARRVPDNPGASSGPKADGSPSKNPSAAPVSRSAQDVEVETRGTSITVRHRNGLTERVSQGRYEMRDSRSRTIVNRRATPSDTSRLRSFDR